MEAASSPVGTAAAGFLAADFAAGVSGAAAAAAVSAGAGAGFSAAALRFGGRAFLAGAGSVAFVRSALFFGAVVVFLRAAPVVDAFPPLRACFPAAFFGAAFFAPVFLGADFFAAGFFPAGFFAADFFVAGFFAAGFFTADLFVVAFFTGAFFAAAFFAAVFFADVFFADVFPAVRGADLRAPVARDLVFPATFARDAVLPVAPRPLLRAADFPAALPLPARFPALPFRADALPEADALRAPGVRLAVFFPALRDAEPDVPAFFAWAPDRAAVWGAAVADRPRFPTVRFPAPEVCFAFVLFGLLAFFAFGLALPAIVTSWAVPGVRRVTATGRATGVRADSNVRERAGGPDR